MNPNWTTRNGRMVRKGLFVNGVWHCDCDARLPAEKFQVKNGGKNHGRWFFTCQKPQPKRCSFFLWADDAKIREEGAVLNNSKSEPGAQQAQDRDGEHWRAEESISEVKPPRTPRTPMRQAKITEPITPVSKMKRLQKTPSPPPTNRSKTLSPAPVNEKHDESFDWSSSADDELAEFADTVEEEALNTEDTSPRKAAKLTKDDSPSKRKQADMLGKTTTASYSTSSDISSTWLLSCDDFPTTPSRQNGSANGLLSPGITPARPIAGLKPGSHFATNPKTDKSTDSRSDDVSATPSALAIEALTILSPIRSSIPSATEQALVGLLNRHDLRAQGISKGREIARVALQNKEKKITELQQRIASLEAERDTSRIVIQHLKSDIATSPKKPRRPYDSGGGPGSIGSRRSEV